MVRGGVGVLVLLAGCKQVLGFDTPQLVADASDVSDSPADAPGSDADTLLPLDASTCYGPPGSWALCFETPPMGAPVALASIINTNTDPRCLAPAWVPTSEQADACMIIGSTITVSGTTQAVGTRHLVLLATDSITISGTLDATRAGGNQLPCSTAVQPFDSSTNVGGGGAGGSHQGRGGNAGNGATACDPQPAYATLRGGPRGQAGGSGFNGGGLHASAGTGGGAVYLVAGTSITISGAVNASGSGGNGGIYYGGGGGGGAGGMIAVYAPSVQAIGILMANGGGGGTQGSNNAATEGGATPAIVAPLTPSPGGMYAERPTGGSGCARGAPATSGEYGGAGGGGSCGYILVNVPLPDATVTPGITSF